MPSTSPPRWAAALFATVALLHLLPVWRVQNLPTVDGPSHLYNAVVLRELAAGTPQFQRVFVADERPNPNWLTYVMFRAALAVTSPRVAEKMVVSAIILLFLLGCWTLGRIYAFLALPLAFHLLLQMGFYNYSIGVALVPFVLAAWWRWREEPGWRANAIIGSLLVLCYLAHVVPAMVAVIFVFIGWCVSVALRGWRRQWLHLCAFIPVALLLMWFVRQPHLPGGTWTWKGALLWQPLLRMPLLLTFSMRQLILGTVLASLYGLLIVMTAIDRKRSGSGFAESDLFLLLTAVAVAIYLAAPVSVQEGLLLKARLLIFPYLVVLAWLRPRPSMAWLAIPLALVAVGNVFFMRDAWKRNDKFIAATIAPIRAAAPLHTIVPLVFDHSTPYSTLGLLGHAASYGATERRLIDFSNYEAAYGFFPVAFRPDVQRPAIFDLETSPGTYDADKWAHEVDYIYTWKMPADAPVASRLQRYELIVTEGEARLYRRK